MSVVCNYSNINYYSVSKKTCVFNCTIPRSDLKVTIMFFSLSLSLSLSLSPFRMVYCKFTYHNNFAYALYSTMHVQYTCILYPILHASIVI